MFTQNKKKISWKLLCVHSVHIIRVEIKSKLEMIFVVLQTFIRYENNITIPNLATLPKTYNAIHNRMQHFFKKFSSSHSNQIDLTYSCFNLKIIIFSNVKYNVHNNIVKLKWKLSLYSQSKIWTRLFWLIFRL